jgi:hypothetical protein
MLNDLNNTATLTYDLVINMQNELNDIQEEVNMTLNNTFEILKKPFGCCNISADIKEVNSSIGNLSAFIGLAYAPVNATMVVGQCNANSTSQVMILGMFVIISLFLITISIVKHIGIIGLFGSIMLLITSWYVVGCSGIIGYLLALFAILMLVITSVVIPWIGRYK